MSDLILFISPNLLKKETNLGGSVDDNNLAPAIRMAQDRYILPALGEKLFETQGGISGITLDTNEETLPEKLHPTCARIFGLRRGAAFDSSARGEQ